ncbi:MAG: acetate--CoA ligase family protein [Beijerinckiaceae bacterium]|nr:acetate--CoA ligase family protein [Beijerinckiaceae bacterium]
MNRTKNIDALFAPRNVALVGASDKNWSARVWENLQRFGFQGAVYPINPGRDSIWGVRCYASLDDLPEPADHLALFLPADQSLQLLEQGGKLGARSATLYAAGFGEGDDAAGRARAEKLRAILDMYGIAATGPNCMGLAVGASGFCTIPDEQIERLAPGPIAVLTQSGMLVQTLSRGVSDAGHTISCIVSCGNQTGLTFADYIDRLADDDRLRVIACYVESVIDGPRFIAAAKKARQCGKTVILVKSGESPAAQAATLAHTGALAGNIAVFDAFAREAGIVRLDNLEDMVEAAAFLATMDRPRGKGVAVMTNSGALRSLATDAADRFGVTLAPLASQTGERILAALPDADVSNPLDTKSTLGSSEYIACIEALHDDPNVDVLLLAEELPRHAGIERKIRNFAALDEWAANRRKKPVAMFSPLSLRETPHMRELRDRFHVLPMLRDLGKTIRTIGRIVAAAPRSASAHTPVAAPAPALASQLRLRARDLSNPTPLNEADSKALLSAYGLATPREEIAAGPSQAAAAAQRIGFPVVLKAVCASLPHKSDAGLVLLGLHNAEAVESAARTLATRCASMGAELEGLLVAQQISGGVEMVLGLHRDPEMGPVVMVGLGGVWLELFKDVAFAPPGLSEADALAAIHETKAASLLAGYRGAPAGDIAALAKAMVAVGRIGIDMGDSLEALDVNPITVTADGAFALDALLVLRGASNSAD